MNSFSGVRVDLRKSRLWLSLLLVRTVTYIWSSNTSLRSPSNFKFLSHSTVSIVWIIQLNTFRDIRTEGEVGQWEEQLKFSGNLLKSILNEVIELKANVSNLYHCRTSSTQSISQRTLFSHTLHQRQLFRIQGISVMSFSGVRVGIRNSRLWLSLWLWEL